MIDFICCIILILGSGFAGYFVGWTQCLAQFDKWEKILQLELDLRNSLKFKNI